MPPKYSTRRHKFKNKNQKTNKEYKRKKGNKPKIQRKKRIERPDEISFNNDERIDFVTGFAKRKQERRIKAAKDLVSLQHQQHIQLKKERREQEIEYLVQSGDIDDPLNSFLEDTDSDYSDSDSSNIGSSDNEINKYENEEMVTTVITSIPSTIDKNIEFMNSAQDMIMNSNDNTNDDESKIKWIHENIYQQRKDKKRKLEIKESKKRYQHKVKKMLQFVKEFNRNKKRKANSKHRKKKRSKKK